MRRLKPMRGLKAAPRRPWYSVIRMFSRQHRKARLLFALADIVITSLAFEAAYQTRIWLHLERVFFLPPAIKALVLGFSLLAWVTIGRWLEIYDRLDAGD